MNFIKKTKIVATIGPATSTEDVIEKMILSGVNVFRVNFSHANYTDVSKRIKMIRNVDEKLKTNTAILGDLQGPKLRVGQIEEGSFLNPGDSVIFSTKKPFEGNSKKAYMNYKNFPKDVSEGEKILLDEFICDGCITILPSNPIVYELLAEESKPSSSEKSPNGQSTALKP